MTDTAQAWRPSPRPRPTGAPSRPEEAPHLRVVPPPADSEVPTSERSQGGGAETITAGQSGSTPDGGSFSSDLGFRVRASAAWSATRAYWTPPAVFTERPPTLADLAVYAKHAPWTAQDRGIVRSFGVWYYRGFGYPYTVVSRYREWFAQRPMRFAALVAGTKLFALTGPGQWVVHSVVYPAAHLAGHIFL